MPFAPRHALKRRLLRLPLAAACLAVALASPSTIHAQQVSPGFAGQVQTTLPSNEQLVGQIQDVLPSTDLNVISTQAGVTASIGQDLVQQLNAALNTAPDDASRSRIMGVLTHVQAALDSLRMAQNETSLDAARGRVNQALGEAQESLSELRPFVLGLFSTGAITGK